MNLKVIFDLDGTLITCENKQKYVLLNVLNSFFHNSANVTDDLNYWWSLKRSGLSTEQALARMDFANATLIAEEWRKAIENIAFTLLDHPFKDSLTTLEYLKKNAKADIFILTSRNNRLPVFQSASVYGFDRLVDDIIVVKPARGSEAKADWLKRMNPSVFIGDTELDYMAAKSTGKSFIALARGQRSREFFNTLGDMDIKDDLSFINDRYIDHLVHTYRKRI